MKNSSFFLVIGLLIISATAAHATPLKFHWRWESGTYSAMGQFTTNQTSGLITETDVLSHVYTVSNNNIPLFTIDLVAATIQRFDGGPATVAGNDHDFAYVIGNNHFELNNPQVIDPEFPVDFTIFHVVSPASNDFTGLYLDIDLTDRAPFLAGTAWFLDISPTEGIAANIGLMGEPAPAGPLVQQVPEPMSLSLLVFGAGIFGVGRCRRRAVARQG